MVGGCYWMPVGQLVYSFISTGNPSYRRLPSYLPASLYEQQEIIKVPLLLITPRSPSECKDIP